MKSTTDEKSPDRAQSVAEPRGADPREGREKHPLEPPTERGAKGALWRN